MTWLRFLSSADKCLLNSSIWQTRHYSQSSTPSRPLAVAAKHHIFTDTCHWDHFSTDRTVLGWMENAIKRESTHFCSYCMYLYLLGYHESVTCVSQPWYSVITCLLTSVVSTATGVTMSGYSSKLDLDPSLNLSLHLIMHTLMGGGGH